MVTVIPTNEYMRTSLVHKLPTPFQKQLKQLSFYGMDQRVSSLEEIIEKMEEQKWWEKIRYFESKYKGEWSGVDCPIYIYPISAKYLKSNKSHVAGGATFKEAVFLFLPAEQINGKKLEALFVHEYHHYQRLNKLPKTIENFTLLDSCVMEGLAEHAVREYCGDNFVQYKTKLSKEEALEMWNKYILPNIDEKKNSKIHDEILFGKGNYGKYLGYELGYWLVDRYQEKNAFSTKIALSLDSKHFL
ncbi:DUF2268 domain-containing putative Zn-dependent protease [Mangrovibacillus cuniculi]|uniref:DUF2268 domain-containing protein n=1 Tax=Mangrovibacillus cuniculi TaxID=2593652 RepID=A0A7S8C9V4_9BACI|nr:DUF2268 domain-containing putative Zn-dependent protease [Mangrovibacillus cuniculi]QPC46064.1 DUF2268 domain-containing protein [Mangrovibacillus cuniculi]